MAISNKYKTILRFLLQNNINIDIGNCCGEKLIKENKKRIRSNRRILWKNYKVNCEIRERYLLFIFTNILIKVELLLSPALD
jgi:hypothetical protein